MKNETKQFFTVLALSLTLICAGYLSGKAQTGQPGSVKTVHTCKATKADKTQCKGTILQKNGFCNAHNPDAIKCAGQTAKKEPCKMTVKAKGEMCRFHTN